jgi:hypothetical protein
MITGGYKKTSNAVGKNGLFAQIKSPSLGQITQE